MSNVFTLDSLREELDKEFAPVTIPLKGGDHATLQNILRMPEKARNELIGLLVELDKERDDAEEETAEAFQHMAEHIKRVLELAAADGKGKKLVAELNGDVLLGMKIIEKWQEATQPGEAQNSPA